MLFAICGSANNKKKRNYSLVRLSVAPETEQFGSRGIDECVCVSTRFQVSPSLAPHPLTQSRKNTF